MNLSAPFLKRPIGTTLLTLGLAIAGAGAFFNLPVAPLPQIDIPTISVSASLPGASPEVMASSVATPLEKRLGHIADVTEMTSSSSTGSTNITLQFGLDRDIDGAARDVQAAINASRVDLPATLKSNPTYRKVNPADAPIMILAMTSESKTPPQIYDAAATIVQQRLLQVHGVGDVTIGGASLPAVRVEMNPVALSKYQISPEDVRAALSSADANRPKGLIDGDQSRWQIYTNDQGRVAADFKGLIVAYRNGAAVRLADIADVLDGPEDIHNLGLYACSNPATPNCVDNSKNPRTSTGGRGGRSGGGSRGGGYGGGYTGGKGDFSGGASNAAASGATPAASGTPPANASANSAAPAAAPAGSHGHGGHHNGGGARRRRVRRSQPARLRRCGGGHRRRVAGPAATARRRCSTRPNVRRRLQAPHHPGASATGDQGGAAAQHQPAAGMATAVITAAPRPARRRVRRPRRSPAAHLQAPRLLARPLPDRRSRSRGSSRWPPAQGQDRPQPPPTPRRQRRPAR